MGGAQRSIVVLLVGRGPSSLLLHRYLNHHWVLHLLLVVHLLLLLLLNLLLLLRELSGLPCHPALFLQPPLLFDIYHHLLLGLLMLELELIGSMGLGQLLVPLHGGDGTDQSCRWGWGFCFNMDQCCGLLVVE